LDEKLSEEALQQMKFPERVAFRQASVNMHRLAEIADDSLRAQAAGLFLIRVTPLALQQLVILHGHASPANPVIPIS
jgi:hypothetical protein